jgi:hypothetical protein
MQHQKKYHDRKTWKILGTMLNIDISILDAHKMDGEETAASGIACGPHLPKRSSYLPFFFIRSSACSITESKSNITLPR